MGRSLSMRIYVLKRSLQWDNKLHAFDIDILGKEDTTMTFMLLGSSQTFCGESYRVPECTYCVKQGNCESAHKVKALWVPQTHRA